MKYTCKRCSWDLDGPGHLALHLIAHHDLAPAEAAAEAGASFQLTPPPTQCWYPADKVWTLLDWVQNRAELGLQVGLSGAAFEEVLQKAQELGLTKEDGQ
jgi:hypothetical protein